MWTEPVIAEVQIVLLGSFNPVIFAPTWFALHGLFSKEEADSAEVQIVHNQITEFQVDWFNLQVTPERFSINTAQAPNVRLGDLVMRVFGELLPHTPVTALGINRNVHAKARSKEAWNQIGMTLAPPAAWGPWQEKLALDGESGGMMSLKMSQLNPDNQPAGSAVNITVEPSNRIGGERLGVYVSINHHFVVDRENTDPSRSLTKIVDNHFDNCISMSDKIVDHVMSLGHENRE